MSSISGILDEKEIFFEDLEEKLESISKKKSFKELQIYAMRCNYKRYGPKAKLKYQYIGLIMENLVFNKNTHLVSKFKDYMIWDYIEEFLKRYYKNSESNERVPKFASFYKNYLKFFCVPTFKDQYCNEMIHNYSEKKAELFYNANYRNKKEKNSINEDCGVFEESESDEEDSECHTSNMNIEKTIFNETVKKKIDKYSPINTSMALPESDTKLKPDDSGLLITSSNETSLVNIMNGMIPPPCENIKNKQKNKNNDKIKNVNNNTISQTNINKNHQGDSSSSYRFSQKNLMSVTLNKFTSQTLQTLLNSQMKVKNKNIFHYSDYSKLAKKNPNSKDKNPTSQIINSNTGIINKNKIYSNNTNNKNKGKIVSYIGIYKKKSIPKSRNKNSLCENGTTVKNQTQINNFINGLNTNKLESQSVNNNQNPNLSNRNNNITSINNYNLNYKQSIQKSRNQQQSTSLNSNTYSKYSFDRINNIKKKININLIKNTNIEYILNQLKIHPFCTLKKNLSQKDPLSNNNNYYNIKKNEKKNNKDKSSALSVEQYNDNSNGNNNSNFSNANNNNQNSKHERPYSHNSKFHNSSSAFDFLKKNSQLKKNNKAYYKGKNNKKSNANNQSLSSNNNNQNDNRQKSCNNGNYKNSKNGKITFEGLLSCKGVPKRQSNSLNYNEKHIHNVNININNQINIGGKQFHELLAFSDLTKKKHSKDKENLTNSQSSNLLAKNIYAFSRNKEKKNNYISRNKNQSLDFNAYTNGHTNLNSYGKNTNSISNEKNFGVYSKGGLGKNLYKTQYKVVMADQEKNKQNKKIKLSGNTLFRSMKAINGNK